VSKGVAEPIEAATVVLIRDRSDGIEVLMVERNPEIHFGGMWVFPGGRVDPADWDNVDRQAPDATREAARAAARRETLEEAGLTAEAAAFIPHSHWLPPGREGRRYSTWFFIADAPPGEVVIDDGEITSHRWITPVEALRLRDAGRIELVPPTWVTLHRLARSITVAEALDEAAHRDPPFFVTQLVKGPEAPVAVWEPDPAYHSGNLDAPGQFRRLVMSRTGWRWEGEAP
jgi:8-oxo-dGTP pyrophosphatase MutT (NUDIX family)